LSSNSQKYGLGSGIPDPTVKKAPDPGSGPATLPTKLGYFLHKLKLTYLFLANPALDDPQVGIPHFRQQRLLGYFITHPFATLSKPKQRKKN
jgi:hypothetical protein